MDPTKLRELTEELASSTSRGDVLLRAVHLLSLLIPKGTTEEQVKAEYERLGIMRVKATTILEVQEKIDSGEINIRPILPIRYH